MSSRDPSWMSPLVRSMLRAKTRISLNNRDRLKLMNSRISQVISENRRNPARVMGSQDWWKNVDLVSQRLTRATCVNLDHASLDHLTILGACAMMKVMRGLLICLSRGMWKFQR